MKKILAFALSGALLFGLCACGGKTENHVEVWTCSSNTKVLRGRQYDTGGKTFSIRAFRNESESAQIILSPERDVASYSIALSDLKSGEGEILKKENFSVYNQKYILVEKIIDTNINATGGWYPDAILPFETAVEYGENKITGGENQGIYITLKVPQEQPAGTYTGEFTVTADGETYAVPASVTVYDFTLPTATHVKSSYAILADEMAYGELDTSNEMLEEYYNFLLDYRVSAQELPYATRGVLSDATLDAWVEYALKYTQDERCSHFNMVYETTSVNNDSYVNKAGETVPYSGLMINVQKMERLYDKLFAKSMQTGVNLFEKMGSYFAVFDEAEVNGLMEYANHSLYHVNKKQAECAEKYKSDPAFGVKAEDKGDEAFRQELIRSVSLVKHKFVGPYSEQLQTEAMYVPTIDNYNTQSVRDLYKSLDREFFGDDGELWSYHCMNPLAPYPTVHIEDEILGTRVMGWIMNDYDVVGSLYWDVTLYAWREDNRNNLQLTDYYSKALRFPSANGDGFLLYPGAPYGIYGPVASVRLDALRDAFEDYDLLYALEEMYLQNGLGGDAFDNAVSILNDRLYNGARVKHGAEQAEVFGEVRETLAQMLVLAQRGVFITNVAELNSKTEFTVQTPSGTAVKSGSSLLNGAVVDENVIYKIDVTRENERNELNATFTLADETLPLCVYVGSRQKTVTADAYDITVRSQRNEYEKETVNQNGGAGIRISSAAVTDGNRNGEYLNIALSGFGIGQKTQKLIWYVYNNSDSARTADVYFQTQGNVAVTKFDSYTLDPGLNIISLDVSIIVQTQTLTNMRLLFADTDALDFTFGEFIVSE